MVRHLRRRLCVCTSDESELQTFGCTAAKTFCNAGSAGRARQLDGTKCRGIPFGPHHIIENIIYEYDRQSGFLAPAAPNASSFAPLSIVHGASGAGHTCTNYPIGQNRTSRFSNVNPGMHKIQPQPTGDSTFLFQENK